MKKIKILSYGPIFVKGGIVGPVKTPYMERESIIRALIIKGLEVIEVLDNGTEVRLTLDNYLSNNQVVEPVLIEPENIDVPGQGTTDEVVVPAVDETEVAPPVEDTVDEVVVPAVDETEVAPPVEETTDEVANEELASTEDSKPVYNKKNKNRH